MAPSQKERGTLLSVSSVQVHLDVVQVMPQFYNLLSSRRLQPKITDIALLVLYPRFTVKECKGFIMKLRKPKKF